MVLQKVQKPRLERDTACPCSLNTHTGGSDECRHPGILKLAAWFELFSVNILKLPFNTGTIIFFIILIGSIVFGLHYSSARLKPALNTVILAFSFMLIGYSSFFMLIIRSNAKTPIDENNPENAMYLLAYLNREQYGDWPLLSGPYYNAPVVGHADGSPVYTKNIKTGRYEISDKKEKVEPVYDPKFTTIFPRMWSNRESRHMQEYIKWGHVSGSLWRCRFVIRTEIRMRPTFGENLTFMWNYQIIHMYFRYFMWNLPESRTTSREWETGSTVTGKAGSGLSINGGWGIRISRKAIEIREITAFISCLCFSGF